MTVLDSGVSAYDPNGNIIRLQRNKLPGAAGASWQDDLRYEYTPNTNRLTHVVPTQAANSYAYDGEGNVTQDLANGIAAVTWNVYARPSDMRKSDGTVITFLYDAAQRRVGVVEAVPGAQQSGRFSIRDPRGQLTAGYEQTAAAGPSLAALRIQGQDRIGILTPDATGSLAKLYELGDQAGTVSMAMAAVRNAGSLDASVVYATNHYPFGLEMPGRRIGNYPFGYHGLEKEHAWRTTGNGYLTEARLYDPSIARWLSPDPLLTENALHTYSFSHNDPINSVDRTGTQATPIDPQGTDATVQEGVAGATKIGLALRLLAEAASGGGTILNLYKGEIGKQLALQAPGTNIYKGAFAQLRSWAIVGEKLALREAIWGSRIYAAGGGYLGKTIRLWGPGVTQAGSMAMRTEIPAYTLGRAFGVVATPLRWLASAPAVVIQIMLTPSEIGPETATPETRATGGIAECARGASTWSALTSCGR
jgi:RHS repeat-associated protein